MPGRPHQGKMAGTHWDPNQYLKFADHRLRPALELLGRVPLAAPPVIYDLGCGSGHIRTSDVATVALSYRVRPRPITGNAGPGRRRAVAGTLAGGRYPRLGAAPSSRLDLFQRYPAVARRPSRPVSTPNGLRQPWRLPGRADAR